MDKADIAFIKMMMCFILANTSEHFLVIISANLLGLIFIIRHFLEKLTKGK